MDNNTCINAFQNYLTEVKKASDNTLASYLRDIRQFGDYISSVGVSYLDADEDLCGEYITHLRSIGKSVATVSRSIASLKNFYYFLCIGIVNCHKSQ